MLYDTESNCKYKVGHARVNLAGLLLEMSNMRVTFVNYVALFA